MTPAPPAAPLSIVHVAAPAPVGGLERVVSGLARGHAALGHRVHVVSIFDAGAAGRPLAEEVPGVTTHVVEVPRRHYWRERAAVVTLAGSLGADIVHTHGYRADVVDSRAARTLRLPLVSTAHGFTGGGLKNRLFELLQLRAYRRFDAVVAVSQLLAERLLRAGVPAGNVHCIPNAWTPEPLLDRAAARAELHVPADALTVCWVGRLSREKAPEILLEALSLLGNGAPVAAFMGDGPQASALRMRAKALRVEHRVRWYGPVDGAAALLPAFDAFVLTSRTEGTPIALLEAMAAGVPVIATCAGGVPAVVSEHEALLVPVDDPHALAGALHRVLTEPIASAERASAARARLEQDFAPQPWLARYEALYCDLLRARTSDGSSASSGDVRRHGPTATGLTSAEE